MCFRGWKVIVLLSPSFYQFPVLCRTVPGVLAVAEGLGQRHVSQRLLRTQHGRHGHGKCQGGSMGWTQDRPEGGWGHGDMVGKTAQTSDAKPWKIRMSAMKNACGLYCVLQGLHFLDKPMGGMRWCFWIGMFTQDMQQICFVDFV